MEKKNLLKKTARWLALTLTALAVGAAVAFSVQWIGLGTPEEAVRWCLGAADAFWLTALLYGGAVWLVGLLTGELWLGALLASAAGVLLALVNDLKTAINGTPLEVEDFGMAGQLDQVMGVAGDLTPPAVVWGAASLLLLLVLLLLALRKTLRVHGPARFLSLSLGLALALIFAAGEGAVSLGRFFSVDMETRIAARIAYRDYGLTLGLWRNCFLLANRAPEDYGPDYMEAVLMQLDRLLAEYAPGAAEPLPAPQTAEGEDGRSGRARPEDEPEADPGPPNVIMLLSESFFDLSRLPGLTMAEDPLANFHRLREESISGRFYSTYVGYGTGYIEMSMFTGVGSTDLRPGVNICFREPWEYTILDSLVQPYKRAGYRAEMLHAYNNTLYNRVNTYPLLGFDELLFSQEVQALDIVIQGSPYAGGYYLSDHVFNEAILKRFTDITGEGRKAFLFGISMENHQPFDADKFGYDCQIGMTSDVLSREDLAIAKVMLEGVTRADQALGELTDALRESEEPTLLFFFGDHRPNLFMTDGDTVYSHLGLCDGNDSADWTIDQVADLYSTDYLLWANDAALLQGRAGERKDASLTAIGPELLALTGMERSRWWALETAVSRILTVNTDLYCVTGEGVPYWNSGSADLTEADRELLALRDAVVYDLFYGQHYIADRMNEPVGA